VQPEPWLQAENHWGFGGFHVERACSRTRRILALWNVPRQGRFYNPGPR
jgi:hypothetical protein